MPPGWFYSRIVATSVLGEVLHCKGRIDPLTGVNAANRQDGTPARMSGTTLCWSLIQQSEILFAQGFLQTAWENAGKSVPADQRAASGTAANA
ncbi:hypothetical protein LQT46_24550 (plasmid) [Escherichia coli]|nr:hypothetical protein LQT46_24550 [Escherichia coli]